MAVSNQTIVALRAEIERKYNDALRALETISAYLADSPIAPLSDSPLHKTVSPNKPISNGREGTTVAKVLGALTSEAKTVQQLADELQIAEGSVRAVLYSKFVKKRVVRGKRGNVTTFTAKSEKRANEHSGATGKPAAQYVREALFNHPAGLTSGEIIAKLPQELKSRQGQKAVGAALYNMKHSGKLSYNTESRKYVLQKA